MNTRLQVLGQGDEVRVETFLQEHPDSSLFLRSNLRRGGLDDRGEPFQGTYAAALDGDRIIGIAAHFWNGLIILQAPTATAPLARMAAAHSGRAVAGTIGPWAQVEEARNGLGLGERPTRLCSREDLFAIEPADLILPSGLDGRFVSRRAGRQDLDALLPWRVAFAVEMTGAVEGPQLWSAEARMLERQVSSGDAFLLEADGRAVSSCAFNARIPETVQIGAVWTPPELRGRGYARAVVAGALRTAASEGARRAVLFTGESNTPARQTYQGLGFRRVGDYGIVLFSS